MVTVHETAGGLGLVVECRGEVGFEELYRAKIALGERLAATPSLCFILGDFTASTLQADAAAIERFAELDVRLAKHAREGLPVAIVAPGDATFGLARMWQVVSESSRLTSQIFRKRAEADNWVRQQVRTRFGVELPPFGEGEPERAFGAPRT